MIEWGEREVGRLWQGLQGDHKGQNGRLLVVGGSRLFHTSVFWSADAASRVVDLVHFTSPINENNEAVRRRLKEKFWGGIVVEWSEVDSYVDEDDCVLIGPGMPRSDGLMEGEKPTSEIVNELVARHKGGRWVIDGGALQEIDLGLMREGMILTPHLKEFKRLLIDWGDSKLKFDFFEKLVEERNWTEIERFVSQVAVRLGRVAMLVKNVGGRDLVAGGKQAIWIEGGNVGLTKGGTGDVLAGLVAAFYCKNKPELAAAGGSWLVKRAADRLYKKRGTFYNASDLIEEVGVVVGELLV